MSMRSIRHLVDLFRAEENACLLARMRCATV